VLFKSSFTKTKSYSSKLPGLDSVLASNPGLLSKIINTKDNSKSQFMTPQEINIEKQKEEFNKKEMDSKKQMLQQQNYIKQLQQQMEQQQHNINSMSMEMKSKNNINEMLQSQKINIETPDNVKNILERIHNISGTNIVNNVDTQDEISSNNDRLISDTTLSDNNPKKKQVRKNKKSNIVIS
jgi:hypothetical protein